MRRLALFAMSVPLLLAQSPGEARPGRRGPALTVTQVRHWTLAETSRVSIQVSGDFNFRTARLQDPDRVYFDILNSRPLISGRPGYTELLEDHLVSRIRVAVNTPEITRVVLDLAEGTEVSTSRLVEPDRLIIELRPAPSPPASPAPPAMPTSRSTADAAKSAMPAGVAGDTGATKTVVRPAPLQAPPVNASRAATAQPDAPTPASGGAAHPPAASPDLSSARAIPPSKPPAEDAPPPSKPMVRPALPQLNAGPLAVTTPSAEQPAPEIAKPVLPGRDAVSETTAVKTLPAAGSSKTPTPTAAPPPLEIAKAARRTSEGQTSLVRALGLKLSRVVIDPGHGGHDQGTSGPRGLLEKDVVLDVSQRLGQLIENRLGAEVIFTRSDDTFLPLQARTALANEKKADLFLSIHANSSSVAPVAGIETFYLSLNGTKYATDVAARENASFEKSLFDLPDLVQQIAKNDKAQESKEFAARVQAALFAFSERNVPGSKDRGVKSAPFVVLIGAHMPSVLTEIGFLTNPKEEALLNKPDYRQKLAEAIYRGVSKYAESLSHFQAEPPATATATKTPPRSVLEEK